MIYLISRFKNLRKLTKGILISIWIIGLLALSFFILYPIVDEKLSFYSPSF